jgi:hypothetical protein
VNASRFVLTRHRVSVVKFDRVVRAVVHDGVAVNSRQQRLRLLVRNLAALCNLIEFAVSEVAPSPLAEETRVAYANMRARRSKS